MEITNKDVKVLGRIASITTDGIVASAEQVYDNTYKEGMFQSDINKELFESIGEVNIPTKVSELENDSNYQSAEQVEQKINDLVNSAPEALDTLKELADALNSDPNFATTVTSQLSNKADKTELDKYLLRSGGEITGPIYSGSKTGLVNDSEDDLVTALYKFTSREEGYETGNIATYFTDTFQIIPGVAIVILEVKNGYEANLTLYSQKQILIYKITQAYSTSTRNIQGISIGSLGSNYGIANNVNKPNILFATDGSTTTLKTINGQSIFGEGNIEINSGDAFPEGGEEGQVLKKTADGVEWANDTDTTYQNATQDAAGLMSSSDKTKLDNLISVPTGGTDGQVLTKTSDGVTWENVQAGSSFPEGGTVGQVLKKTESGTEWANDNNTTYENASQSSAGLMSSADKTKLDNLVEIPSGGTEGQVLKKTSTGVEWSNDSDTIVTVNNTLESDSTTEALSAAQGKALNEKIEALEIPEEYTLPTATSSQLGGVKIGEGITVQADGTISAADDVVTLVNLSAAKGDIAAICAAGPFTANLYFINSPVTEGIMSGIDTGDYYHLCVKRSTGDDYYETTCSNVANSFSNINAYFNIVGTVIYLKNNVIYHATGGTDAGYFVSNEKGDTLTNVASRFETLAEARAFMREKMLALPDIGIVKCTSEEYEGGAKDENTLYIIHG